MTSPQRPLATVGVIAFRQAWCVREAVEALFAQTYAPLQIILSDDCSPDGTFDVLRELAESYSGPHQIVLNRTERNSGIGGHVNAVMKLAKGDFFFIAAGDDVSLPRRVEKVMDHWLASGRKRDFIVTGYQEITRDGAPLQSGSGANLILLTPEQMARYGHGVVGATESWSRRLWERWGDLPDGVISEDQVVTFRAMLSGGIDSVPEPLVKYRQGVSTWMARGKAGHAEMQRRARLLARNALLTAQIAREDALRAGRIDLLPLLDTRIREAELLHRMNGDAPPSMVELVAGAIAGARAPMLMRAYARTRVPFANAAVNRLRRLRGNRRW